MPTPCCQGLRRRRSACLGRDVPRLHYNPDVPESRDAYDVIVRFFDRISRRGQENAGQSGRARVPPRRAWRRAPSASHPAARRPTPPIMRRRRPGPCCSKRPQTSGQKISGERRGTRRRWWSRPCGRGQRANRPRPRAGVELPRRRRTKTPPATATRRCRAADAGDDGQHEEGRVDPEGADGHLDQGEASRP